MALRRRRWFAAPAVAVCVAAAACSSSASANTHGRATALTVLAAASLSRVFPEMGSAFTAAHPGVRVRFSFAGTDALAAQIAEGAPADVFAGASTTFGDDLFTRGLIDRPVAFCTNSLVVVVPVANPADVRSVPDLARRGLKLVIGSASVPVGSYTRKVLRNLDRMYGSTFDSKVLANVVSDEQDAESVVAKVSQAEADAGVVYVTDWEANRAGLTAVPFPSSAQTAATYPIAAVRSGHAMSLARAFVAFVLGRGGQALLRRAGFGAPPPP